MRNKVWKRCLATVMAVAMMFTSTDFAYAETGTAETLNETVASLLSANHSGMLSEAEYALLSHPVIKANATYSFNDLSSADIAIDPENKTVIVGAESVGNGYTWYPSGAYLQVNGSEDVPITLNQNADSWIGSFSTDSISYSVVVDYYMPIAVDKSAVEALVAVREPLFVDYDNLETYYSIASNMGTLVDQGQSFMDSELTFAGMTFKMFDALSENGQNAWTSLVAWEESNALLSYVTDYCYEAGTFKISGLRTEVEGETVGALLLAEGQTLSGYFGILAEELATLNPELSGQLNSLVSKINSITSWNVIDNASALFVDGVDASAFAQTVSNMTFDQAVAAAKATKTDAVTYPTYDQNNQVVLISGHKAQDVAQTNMYYVTLSAVAKVAGVSADNYPNGGYTIQVEAGATKEEVQAKVEVLLADILNNYMDDTYKVDAGGVLTQYYNNNIDAVYASIPETLNETWSGTIEFTPIQVTVDYAYDEADPISVLAGEVITLESSQNAGKAFVYDVTYENGQTVSGCVEGQTIAVWEALVIDREEMSTKELNEVIGKNFKDLTGSASTSTIDAIINSDAIKSEYIYITEPAATDYKVTLTGDSTVTVAAEDVATSIANMSWKPYKAVVKFDSAEDKVSYFNGANTINIEGCAGYSAVEVYYRIGVTYLKADDALTSDEVKEIVNLPYDTVSDASIIMSKMQILNERTARLSEVTGTILELLQGRKEWTADSYQDSTGATVAIGVAADTKSPEIIAELRGSYLAGTNKFKLYEYLNELSGNSDAEFLKNYYEKPETVDGIINEVCGIGSTDGMAYLLSQVAYSERLPYVVEGLKAEFPGYATMLDGIEGKLQDLSASLLEFKAYAAENNGLPKKSEYIIDLSSLDAEADDYATKLNAYNTLCSTIIAALSYDRSAAAGERYTVDTAKVFRTDSFANDGVPTIDATAFVSVAAPDRKNISINFEIGKTGGDATTTAASVTQYMIDDGVQDAQLTWLQNAYATLVNECGVADIEDYYTDQYKVTVSSGDAVAYETLDAVCEAIKGQTEDISITVVWTPIEYKTTGAVVTSIYSDVRVLTLPALEDPSKIVVYTFNGTTYEAKHKEVIAVDLTGLEKDAFDALVASGFPVTKTEEDRLDVTLEAFVDSLNKELAGSALKNEMAFMLYEDAEKAGEYTIVLRMGANMSQDALTSAAGFINKLISSEYKEITLGDNTFVKGGQMSLQALIDVLLDSGLSKTDLQGMINADGTIRNDRDKIANGENTLTYVAGTSIPANGVTGSILAESTMDFVLSLQKYNEETKAYDATDYTETCKLYITLADVVESAESKETYKSLEEALGMLGGIEFELTDGAMKLSGALPDDVYSYFMVFTLIMGQADLSDVSAVDMAEALNTDYDIFKTVIDDPNFDAQDLQNTLDMLGVNLNVTSKATMMNAALKVIRQIEQTDASYKDGVVDYDFLANIGALIPEEGALSMLNTVLMEEEVNEGLSFGLALDFDNFGDYYDALIISADVDAKSFSLSLAKNAKEIGAAADGSVVVLLSDVGTSQVPANVSFANGVYLDLNGKTIYGNLHAAKALTVFDSAYANETVGGVTGAVTAKGAISILAGKYSADVVDFVPVGFVVDEETKTVKNAYFTVTSENDTITVDLTGNVFEATSDVAYKKLAADIVYDIVLDFYNASEIIIGEDTIYSINVDDVIGSVDAGIIGVVNSLLGNIDDSEQNAVLSYGGIENFANDLLSKLTGFAQIAEDLKGDGVLAEYTVKTKGYALSSALVDNGDKDYVTLNVGTNAETAENYTLVIKVTDETVKTKLAEEVEKLDAVVDVTEATVSLDDIIYGGGTNLDIKGAASFKMTVDLIDEEEEGTQELLVLFAKIMQNGLSTSAEKASMQNAIDQYTKYGVTTLLEKEIESLTAAEMYNAVKKASGINYANIFVGDGDKAEEYANIAKALSILAQKANLSMGSATLGNYESSVDGTYVIPAAKGNVTAELTLQLLTPVEEGAPELGVLAPEKSENTSVKITGIVADKGGVENVTLTVHSSLGGAEETIAIAADGTWEYDATISGVENAVTTFTFTATNKAGKETTVVKEITFGKSYPVVTVTGGIPEDITKDTKLTITGSVADEGNDHDIVTVKVGNVEKTTSVSENGIWTIEVDIVNGTNEITIYATDKAGNKSEEVVKTVTCDTVAPQLHVEEVASLTRWGQIEVSGSASDENPGLELTVSVGTAWSTTVTVGADGKWSTRVPLTANTENTITVVATDKVGNKTSAETKVTQDSIAPTLNVEEMAGTDELMIVTDAEFTISGETTDASGIASVLVIVNNNAKTTTYGEGDAWSAQVELEADVKSTILVIAEDNAGNSSSATYTVVYDATAPTLEVYDFINLVDKTEVQIRGKATDNGAGIDYVLVNGTLKVAVNADGEWSVLVTGLKENTVNELTFVAVDKAGRKSEIIEKHVTCIIPDDPDDSGSDDSGSDDSGSDSSSTDSTTGTSTGTAANTGDNSNVTLWMTLLAFAVLTVIGLKKKLYKIG